LEAIKSNLDTIAGFHVPGGTVYEGDTYFIAGGNSKYVRIKDVPEIQEVRRGGGGGVSGKRRG